MFDIESLRALPSPLATSMRIVAIVIVTAFILRLVRVYIPRFREALAVHQGTQEDVQRIHTLSRVLRYVLSVTVTVVASLLVLGELGLSVAPLLGAAGVAGLAIGFGAQSLVKDFFSGFFLLLENQVRIGDVVEVGGKSGVVEELTLRYLRLRDYSGNAHYIPNGQITIVTNMSLGFAYAVIDINAAYDENIDAVIACIRQVGEELRQNEAFGEKILEDLEVAGVDQLAESAIVIRCRLRVVAGQQWDVRREFLRRAKLALDAEGIATPMRRLKIFGEQPTAG